MHVSRLVFRKCSVNAQGWNDYIHTHGLGLVTVTTWTDWLGIMNIRFIPVAAEFGTTWVTLSTDCSI